jgi:hypothetical protein
VSLVVVVGRGHSGTRIVSQTLQQSGVFMGDRINPSGDLVPPDALYEATRVFARYVEWQGGTAWSFDVAEAAPIPPKFDRLVRSYLASVLASGAEHRGWKLPETTLVYPWIRRMFPEAKFVSWLRDPRDAILGRHLTDDLRTFGIHYPLTDDVLLRRAISWKYQYDIVHATPRPAEWIEVRFEDFVLRQEETVARLEAFLGFPLARVAVDPEPVGRWLRHRPELDFDFLRPAMAEAGYD